MKREQEKDGWKHRSAMMRCHTCMWFVPKAVDDKLVSLGRCRKHAPSPGGWVPVFQTDWCGDHRLDEINFD